MRATGACRYSLATMLALCGGVASAATAATATAQEPRAFGYSVGDVVSRVVTVQVPRGLELDAASLPQGARRGQAIELRRISQRSFWQAGGRRHELTLEYQVFLSPPELRTLELPPFTLRLKGSPRDEELRIDAWPLTVGPLAPVEPRMREGLGEMRPDARPPPIDTSATGLRLLAYGAATLPLLGYLAHVYVGLPWAVRRRRPFTVAWRALHGLPPADLAERRHEIYRRLHEALNQTAGLVVFEPDLGRFMAAHPQFADLRDEWLLFFQRSREQFFASSGTPAADHDAWLLRLCRQCRDAERGAA
jgi:mxaA protein